MKIAVIGAGISGLAVSQLLKKNNNVVVFEANDRVGGLIRCDLVKGCLFHRTGGHVFNSKRNDVMDFFWSFFSKDADFTLAKRNATVVMQDGNFIPYPIENFLYKFSSDSQRNIIKDLLKVSYSYDSNTNFEEFLINNFGETLYNLYFKPYNQKIWRRDLSKVPLSWLKDKLPMPNKEEIFYNNISRIHENKFVHSSFYYPRKNGSQFIADTLSKGLNIVHNSYVKSISRVNHKWQINSQTFDIVIFCGNIKQLDSLLRGAVDLKDYEQYIKELDYHGTTSVFCKIDNNPYSWIYQPSPMHSSHRIICTGNFSTNNNAKDIMTATVEFTDYISKEQILSELKCMPFSPEYICHNYEKYTYPIQNNYTREMICSLKQYLNQKGIFLCGRFAEWEYSNMDVCIGSALDLCKDL